MFNGLKDIVPDRSGLSVLKKRILNSLVSETE